MISKKQFFDIFERYRDSKRIEREVEKITGFQLYDSQYCDTFSWLFDRLIEQIVKKEFVDLITNYIFPGEDFSLEMWDRPEHPLTWEENGKKYSLATIEDLYNYLVENNGLNPNY